MGQVTPGQAGHGVGVGIEGQVTSGHFIASGQLEAGHGLGHSCAQHKPCVASLVWLTEDAVWCGVAGRRRTPMLAEEKALAATNVARIMVVCIMIDCRCGVVDRSKLPTGDYAGSPKQPWT